MKLSAFVTGSQIYGKPTAASDIDLVVFMSDTEQAKLSMICTNKSLDSEDSKYPNNTRSFRFGNLNIIAIQDELVYMAWLLSKKACEKIKPLDHDQAVAVHELIRGGVDQQAETDRAAEIPS